MKAEGRSLLSEPRVEALRTEGRNPRTVGIDGYSTVEMLRILNREDQLVAPAVAAVLEPLAQAVDETVTRLSAGGKVHYFGAGTSGRIAVMDAAELIPTFGIPVGLFTAHHAGGGQALQQAIEDAEDHESLGTDDAESLGAADVAVGVTASGRTLYVTGALRRARSSGAFTVLVTANPTADLCGMVDVAVAADTGPEAIAGSTRLKAATAQKFILNSYSTAVMVRLGKTYSNLMVEVRPSNSKLRRRMLTILTEASGADEGVCRQALTEAGEDLKVALVSLLGATRPEEAIVALRASDGRVREALQALGRAGDAVQGWNGAGATAEAE